MSAQNPKPASKRRAISDIKAPRRQSKKSVQKAAETNPDQLEKIINKIEKTKAATRSKSKKSWKEYTSSSNRQEIKAAPDFPSIKKNLSKIRSDLPVHQRLFSKFIHLKSLEKINEGLAHTIARPSGLLGGASFSLTASAGALFISRYYGYEYNYLASIAAYSVGYIIGILIELISKFKRS